MCSYIYLNDDKLPRRRGGVDELEHIPQPSSTCVRYMTRKGHTYHTAPLEVDGRHLRPPNFVQLCIKNMTKNKLYTKYENMQLLIVCRY